MAQQVIGQGPGNNVPDSHTKMFKCAATITKGWAVALSGEDAVDALQVTYGEAAYKHGTTIEGAITGVHDAIHGIGFAKESGVLGGWIEVVVGGFCDYIVTDGSVVEGDHLVPTASAGVVEGTAGTTSSILGFGIALIDDASTLLTAAIVEPHI